MIYAISLGSKNVKNNWEFTKFPAHDQDFYSEQNQVMFESFNDFQLVQEVI